ncbi:DUF2752 domain-containing protein [Nocardioides nanhaiensis]|uniref:DUF2752 domain-containing protein n=1 Tax=Nocardioides nanhaiensis TaxID=1476871 RepID=A0ABP8WEG4_9ACTN
MSATPGAPPSRRLLAGAHTRAASAWVAGTGVAAIGVAALLSPATIDDGPVLCPFRAVTGLPCPGCGLTRSWVQLVHGDPAASFAAHPFGAVLMALVLALAAVVLLAAMRRRPLPDFEGLVRRPWLVVLLGGWLVFGVLRLVSEL